MSPLGGVTSPFNPSHFMPLMAAIPKTGKIRQRSHSGESRKSIGSYSNSAILIQTKVAAAKQIIDFSSLKKFVQSLSLLSPAATSTHASNTAFMSPAAPSMID